MVSREKRIPVKLAWHLIIKYYIVYRSTFDALNCHAFLVAVEWF